MKAEMSLFNGHSDDHLHKKKGNDIFTNLNFPKTHAAAEMPENESGLIVIPVENLNDVQLQKLQKLTGPPVNRFNNEVSHLSALLVKMFRSNFCY